MTVHPANTEISLGICPVWSETLLFAWRNLGSLATHLMDSEDSDQTGRMPRLIWVFTGWKVIFFCFFSSPVRSTRRAIAVTPGCVRVCVPVTLRQSFIFKFSKSSYLDSHSSESIHLRTIGTLEGWLSFHISWPQGWCPRVGLEVKI